MPAFNVLVSEVIVDHFLPGYSMREFLDHQLRWSRTIRDSRPWGYAGLIVTFPLVWAALAVLLSAGAAWSWWLLAIAAALRALLAAIAATKVLRDRQFVRDGWLIPLRDVLALFIWIASFAWTQDIVARRRV